MSDLSGRVAIVTGAAQGIGAAYARGFAGAGAKVVAADILDCGPIAREIEAGYQGAEVLPLTCDVSDPASVNDMVAETVRQFGRLDVLVNNAALFGTLQHMPFSEITPDLWDKVMAVNVRGPFLCIQAAVAEMKKTGYGKIVNIASDVVMKGLPGLTHYASSKGAVLAMTRSLAKEIGPDGIRINAVAPGLTMSDNVRANRTEQRLARHARVIEDRAIPREQLPEDLVGAVLFLASPESDFMTGQCMVVNGGEMFH